MVEAEVVSSLISPWLTPTSLFVLLNIVLATIFLLKNHDNNNNDSSSNNSNDYKGYEDGAALVPPPPQLTRAPSLFSRVASFNISNYYSESSHVPHPDEADRTVTLARAPSLLYRVASFNFRRAPPSQEAEEERARDGHVRSEKTLEDDVHRGQEQVGNGKGKGKKVNNKKKKGKKNEAQAVVQEVVKKKNEVVEVKEEKKEKEKETTSLRVEEEQVDSRADDFINRFKQNLKMQRLDSLLRYRNNTVAA